MTEYKQSIDHRCPYATGTHKMPCIWCKVFELEDRIDGYESEMDDKAYDAAIEIASRMSLVVN